MEFVSEMGIGVGDGERTRDVQFGNLVKQFRFACSLTRS